MKIIHLVSNKVWGGGEQYVIDLATTFAAKGNEVTIVSRDIDTVTRRFKDAGLPVTTMALKGAIDIASPFRLAKLIGKEQPVVIHVHNFKDATTALRARALSRNRNVRIVMTRHLVKAAKRISLYNKLDAMIFVSHLAKNEFMSTSPVIDATKVHVIHNSIKHIPGTAECTPNKELTLMFHGRLSPEKGIDTLLQAFAKAALPSARLIIAGGGNDAQYEAAARFADHLGLAFQIRDDMLDVIGTQEEMGKGVGTDAAKNTFVRLYGLEKCEELVQKYTRAAICALNVFSDTGYLIDLATALTSRTT